MDFENVKQEALRRVLTNQQSTLPLTDDALKRYFESCHKQPTRQDQILNAEALRQICRRDSLKQG